MGRSDLLRLLGRETAQEGEEGGMRAQEEKEMQTLDSLGDGEYPSSPLKVTNDNLEEVIQRFPLVVVDCWADWCGPCSMIAPVIAELAKDYQGKIVFGKLDVDKNRKIAIKYRIMSIPALLVFKNGEIVDQIIGAMPRGLLEPKITKHL